jgi:predicted RNase H-like nuclease (RuvC/YqgF family)
MYDISNSENSNKDRLVMSVSCLSNWELQKRIYDLNREVSKLEEDNIELKAENIKFKKYNEELKKELSYLYPHWYEDN